MSNAETILGPVEGKVLSGEGLDRETALELGGLSQEEVPLVTRLASQVARKFEGNRFDLCSIVNARSGRCPEDCAFCAQSVHHHAEAPIYPMMGSDKILELAKRMESLGAHRFSIVTSGKGVPRNAEFASVLEAVKLIRADTSLKVCASTGVLNAEEGRSLKEAGVVRYHHNLEACRGFYPEICSSHSYEERASTVRTAREAGLEVCSGGIIGLGEGWEHRVDLALELAELGVDSVPLNILDPIPGTPLEAIEPLPLHEILLTIAMFRLVNPRTSLRLAGGREKHVGGERAKVFTAGLSGVMIGDLLTTRGADPKEDVRTLDDLGFVLTG